MKKLILTVLTSILLVSVACAGCRIGANWTVDPVGASVITGQELWHNPDGIVSNGDEVMGAAYDNVTVTGNFLSATDCTAMPNMTVFVKTKYIGAIEVDSPEVIPSGVVGAILGLAIQHTE